MENKIPGKIPGKKWYQRWWVILFLILLIFWGLSLAASRILMSAIKTQQKKIVLATNANLESFFADLEQVDKIKLTTTDDPSFGPENAPVVIVEFSDFQCPYCAQAHSAVRQLQSLYPDKLQFIYRDFPVSSLHPQAQKAAEAGECAQEQGKFWALHDKIFQNQADLDVDSLKNYALQIGLDEQEFARCLDSGQFSSEVEDDLLEGYALGVRVTPTFFVNGYKIEGAIPLEIFQRAIETLLTDYK